MSQSTSAISFIREHLKYKATKRYVGGLSGCDLSRLWRTINGTEINGIPHKLYCGRINAQILRDAFLHEMSYNPVRFEMSLDGSQQATDIVNSVNNVIARFTNIFPHGITDFIYVIDTSDPQYKILCDVRNCFIAIARQNTTDLKSTEYRDEIVARFASDTMIHMDAQMRATLRAAAEKSAMCRKQRRDIAGISFRISVLDVQIKMHRVHDRATCLELQAEHDALKRRLDILTRGDDIKKDKEVKSASPITIIESDNDAAEREMELLRSLTPEHTIDDIFRQYAKTMLENQR